MDTIYALSSGRPPAAIAIVRISGARAMAAAEALAGPLPPPRRAELRTLRDAEGGVLDRGLVLVFPAPHSATGDDVIELHLHGGRAVVHAIEATLATTPGLRPAEPGEFTRRALEAGIIDLAEAEGLADLLEAETESARKAALATADGRLSRRVRGWLDRLGGLAAETELRIEFAEEEDSLLPRDDVSTAALAEELRQALAKPRVERLRDGVRVVVAGPPNTGKSSLVNALAGRDVAIVTAIAGTTRDKIEAAVQRAGMAYVLIDTAGQTETDDPVEAIGVELSYQAVDEADIILWTGPLAHTSPKAIMLATMSDLFSDDIYNRLPVSIFDPASVENVWQAITQSAAHLLPHDDAMVLNQRQASAIANAEAELRAACGTSDDILAAEHFRRSHRSLAAIFGIDATEFMLDALFGRFCIGK